MKKILFLTIITIFSLNKYAQTNESDASQYSWDNGTTDLQSGYVVLKSGKKLLGEISLKGAPESLTTITFIGDGKEINFPPTALKAFGLNDVGSVTVIAPVVEKGLTCDVPENLFVWRDMGVQMDKQIDATQPRNGYVILKNGTKYTGTLKLKKIDGVLSQFNIKGDDKKKHKFTTSQIANYGLLLTINELTKDGSKTYKDQARNFHSGTITMKDGAKKTGLIAFREKTYINPNKTRLGYKYMGLYYAASKTELVTTFNTEEVKEITRNVEGTDVNYYKHQGGFVNQSEMDNAKFKDATRAMQKGFVVLNDGTKKEGMIALDKDGAFYATGLRYKDPSGKISSYSSNEVKSGSQTIGESEIGFLNIEGKLVECLTDGATFRIFRNPKPTTINEKKTNTARTLTELSTTGIASFVISRDEMKEGYSTNLDSIIQVSSIEELEKIQTEFYKIQGYSSSEELQDKSTNATAKKYDAALGLAIGGKKRSQEIVVYNKEYVIVNKSENTEIIVNSTDYKEKMNPILMGCYTYLSLGESEQNKHLDFENLQETAKMLTDCY